MYLGIVRKIILLNKGNSYVEIDFCNENNELKSVQLPLQEQEYSFGDLVQLEKFNDNYQIVKKIDCGEGNLIIKDKLSDILLGEQREYIRTKKIFQNSSMSDDDRLKLINKIKQILKFLQNEKNNNFLMMAIEQFINNSGNEVTLSEWLGYANIYILAKEYNILAFKELEKLLISLTNCKLVDSQVDITDFIKQLK